MTQDKQKPIVNLWAIVLAGGPNSRRGATGQQIPTVYQPIGLEPVINCAVSACLNRITSKTGKVIILTRKKHPQLINFDNKKVDLESWTKGWLSSHFPRNDAIDIWFEENAIKTSTKYRANGSCIALSAFIELLDIVKYQDILQPTHVLIVAGDNYFDDDLIGIQKLVENNPEVGAVAIRELDDSADAIGRFGVVEINSNLEIRKYEEKPNNTNDYKHFAPAIYCLPIEQLRLVDDHIKQCLDSTPQETTKIGPPGYFIEYLISNKQKLKGYELPGVWVNIDTKTGYLSSIIQLTANLLRQPKSAKELFAMGDAMSLSDKSYFLCDKVKIDAKARTIYLDFYGNDKVAVLDSNKASDSVLTVKQVREGNSKNKVFWEAITQKTDYIEKTLPSPILISGGVFLLNQPHISKFFPNKAQVPLLMRDITANVDPLRLTMPAGRMDQLNLADVCVSELAEEMIFFGGETGHQVFFIAPEGYESKVFKIVKSRLSKGKVIVPGLDPAKISENSYLVNSPGQILPPPNSQGWKVQIRYKEDENNPDWIITQQPIDEFALIPDQSAATLEFRLTVASNLTGPIDGNPSKFDQTTLKLGNLRGVIDGDGYERMVLFVSYEDLQKYVQELDKKGGAVLKTSDPHNDALPIIAITDGKSGRFRKIPDNYRLSVTALTTTLSELVTYKS